MKRRSRYKNTNVSLVAGIIVMAVTAVALGYLLGNWMIKFVTGTEINPVASEPEVQDEIIVGEDTNTTNETEDESDEMTAINPPGNATTPSIEGGDLFVVQLGAFNKYSNAVGLRDDLLAKGYNSVMITEGPPYKVQLRAAKTREEAEDIEDQVKQDGFVDVFIVH